MARGLDDITIHFSYIVLYTCDIVLMDTGSPWWQVSLRGWWRWGWGGEKVMRGHTCRFEWISSLRISPVIKRLCSRGKGWESIWEGCEGKWLGKKIWWGAEKCVRIKCAFKTKRWHSHAAIKHDFEKSADLFRFLPIIVDLVFVHTSSAFTVKLFCYFCPFQPQIPHL